MPILVSLEPMYLINTTLFRKHIDSLLAGKNIPKFDWQVIPINELEAIQPHLIDGIKLSQVLEDLRQKRFNEVLYKLVSKTNKSFGDSFLASQQEEIYGRLGILDKLNQMK